MREKNIIRLLVGVTLVAITALGVLWFMHNFELATREVSSGYSQEARRNPLLAAERYLKRLDVSIGSLSYTELWHTQLNPDDVVLFYHFLPPKSSARQQKLRKWLESGGQMIIDASTLVRTRPAEKKVIKHSGDLLAELGVAAKPREVSSDNKLLQRVEINFVDEEKPVAVTLTPTKYLVDTYDKAGAGVEFDEGYALLQYDVGEGWLTVLADTSFLNNHRINEEDNALALALLVGMPKHGKVWLVHDITMPSLAAQAWNYAPYAVIATAIAILLWVWSLNTRLGPALPPAEQPRRDIGEHLAASAHYLWRLDRGKSLLRENRQRVEQAWLNKHYLLRTLPLDERCEWIGARAGLAPEKVQRALYDEHQAESDFIELSSYLQLLQTTL